MSEPSIIKIERHYEDEWTATTDDYDGPGSPMGSGNTWRAAVEDLMDKLEEEP